MLWKNNLVICEYCVYSLFYYQNNSIGVNVEFAIEAEIKSVFFWFSDSPFRRQKIVIALL